METSVNKKRHPNKTHGYQGHLIIDDTIRELVVIPWLRVAEWPTDEEMLGVNCETEQWTLDFVA